MRKLHLEYIQVASFTSLEDERRGCEAKVYFQKGMVKIS